MANCDHVAAVRLVASHDFWLRHSVGAFVDLDLDLDFQMRFYIIGFWYSIYSKIYILLAAGDDDDGRWCYCDAITIATCYYIVLVSFIVDYVLARILPLKFNCSRYLVSVLFWQFSLFLSLNCYAVLSNIQPNRKKYTPTHKHTAETDTNGIEMERI